MSVYGTKISTPRSAAHANRSNDIEHKGNAERKARHSKETFVSPIENKIIRVNGKPRG